MTEINPGIDSPLTICKRTRAALVRRMEDILDGAELAGRKLQASETRKFTELKQEMRDIDDRIIELESENEQRQTMARSRVQLGMGTSATARGGEGVYAKGGAFSYFGDMVLSSLGGPDRFDAEDRLRAHAEVIDRAEPDLPAEFRSGPNKRAAGSSVLESRVNPTRVGGQGGYSVPPLWIIDELVPYLRAGRACADLFESLDLPGGTDSINVPKLTLGTLAGVQMDGGAVPSQDITDSYVTAPVRTIAGQEDFALALLEQSPIASGLDQYLIKDLTASYNQQIDFGCISGTGTNGALKGLANIVGTTQVTWTQATPSPYQFWSPITQAMSQVAKLRFEAPTAILMHPSRWYWLLSGLDTTNRPLIVPEGVQGFNQLAVIDPNAVQGVAGKLGGVPIVLDANIPVNLGAGANQDTVYVAKFDDLWLYEGAIRSRVLLEPLSGTLQVRVQLYNYVAALVDRFPVSVAQIQGTGLIAQSGY